MRSALLLVDFQHDFLAGPRLTPHREALIAAAARALAGFRAVAAPVFHVVTTVQEPGHALPHWQSRGLTRCLPGTPGHTSPEPLTPSPTEPVFHKRGYSGCEDPRLVAALRAAGVQRVHLCGVHLRACLRGTAIDLALAGFDVVLVDEACGDDDPVHGTIARDWLLTRFGRNESLSQVLETLSLGDCTAGASDREVTPVLAGVSSTTPLARTWHHSPANGEPLFEVELQRESEIQAATRRCRTARGDWHKTPIRQRVELLLKVAEAVARQSEPLARQITRETGKPIVDSRLEVTFGVALMRDVCGRVGEAIAADSGPGWQLLRRPQGTLAIITPWNNPLAIPLGKLAPALVHGNAVAWKPAPAGWGLARALASVFAEQGLPHGLVTLISGDRQTVELLIRDAAIDAVSLTGSEAAGLSCQLECLRRAIPFQGELGGNNAAVVWDPVDGEMALQQTARGAFGAAGQRCTANRRLIVPRGELERVLNRLAEITGTLPWGDPEAEETVIGPVINAASRDRLTALINRTRQAGHRVLVPHGQENGTPRRDPRGAYVAPVLVVCNDPQAELVQEESFGPLLVIQPAEHWNHALELCEGVRQGLVAALWSNSANRQHEFLDRVRVGMVKFNQSTAGATAAAPFGGWKHSGVGPFEHGLADREFYTRLQTHYSPSEISVPSGSERA